MIDKEVLKKYSHQLNNWRDFKGKAYIDKPKKQIVFKNGIAYEIISGKHNFNIFRRVQPKSINKSIDHKKLIEYYRDRICYSCIKKLKFLAENKKDATLAIQELRLAQTLADPRSSHRHFGKKVINNKYKYRVDIKEYHPGMLHLQRKIYFNSTKNVADLQKLTLLFSKKIKDDKFITLYNNINNESFYISMGNKSYKEKCILNKENLHYSLTA
jgi:hypothetical protein